MTNTNQRRKTLPSTGQLTGAQYDRKQELMALPMHSIIDSHMGGGVVRFRKIENPKGEGYRFQSYVSEGTITTNSLCLYRFDVIREGGNGLEDAA